MEKLKTYPLSLSASVTLQPGTVVEPQTTNLQNPTGSPYLIDEIRVKINNTTAGSPGPVVIPDPHIAIGMSLFLGRTPLTNGFVPIGNFGRVLLNSYQQGQEGAKWEFTWRLWRPILLHPGEFLVPKFNYTPNLGIVNTVEVPAVPIDIVYAGRRIIDPNFVMPDSMVVPWVSSFMLSAQSWATGTGFKTDVSKETDLVNMHDTPLFVQRFIGRYGWLSRTAAPVPASSELSGSEASSLLATAYTNVRAVDSQGTILIRDPAPWTQVFHFPDRCWDVHTTLAPKGFYLFTVDRNFAALSVEIANINALGAISMVGYREISTRRD